MKDKKYCKVSDHCHYTGEYRGAVHSIFIFNLKYRVPKIFPVFFVFINCDYHIIVKELAEKFKIQFICLGENIEKYIRIDKNGKEITKYIPYVL